MGKESTLKWIIHELCSGDNNKATCYKVRLCKQIYPNPVVSSIKSYFNDCALSLNFNDFKRTSSCYLPAPHWVVLVSKGTTWNEQDRNAIKYFIWFGKYLKGLLCLGRFTLTCLYVPEPKWRDGTRNMRRIFTASQSKRGSSGMKWPIQATRLGLPDRTHCSTWTLDEGKVAGEGN